MSSLTNILTQRNIRAIVFDLDDTLYPEISYVKSGFCEVGKEIERRFGIADASDKLWQYFSVDKNDVYGRVLSDSGVRFDKSDIADLVEIYRTHNPKIELFDDTEKALISLRERGYKIGIITDGRVYQQHAKIEALGLSNLVDEIIVTDELGGVESRKPNPLAFGIMCERLGVKPEDMVYVGDNPQKDFFIGSVGVLTVRIKRKGALNLGGEDYYKGIKEDFLIGSLK